MDKLRRLGTVMTDAVREGVSKAPPAPLPEAPHSQDVGDWISQANKLSLLPQSSQRDQQLAIAQKKVAELSGKIAPEAADAAKKADVARAQQQEAEAVQMRGDAQKAARQVIKEAAAQKKKALLEVLNARKNELTGISSSEKLIGITEAAVQQLRAEAENAKRQQSDRDANMARIDAALASAQQGLQATGDHAQRLTAELRGSRGILSSIFRVFGLGGRRPSKIQHDLDIVSQQNMNLREQINKLTTEKTGLSRQGEASGPLSLAERNLSDAQEKLSGLRQNMRRMPDRKALNSEIQDLQDKIAKLYLDDTSPAGDYDKVNQFLSELEREEKAAGASPRR